jgi:predicted nucleic acid-binding protein
LEVREWGERLQPAITALAEVHDSVEAEFWAVLQRIARASKTVEPTPEIIDLTTTIRDSLDLSPADSSVLATVVALKRSRRCDAFMSRDREAFGAETTREYLRIEGIDHCIRPASLLK